MTINELIDIAIEQKSSDLHLASGEVPFVRISGQLDRLDLPILNREDVATIVEPLLTPELRVRYQAGRVIGRTYLYGEFVISLIMYRCGDEGLAATFRIIRKDIPALEIIGEGAIPLMEKIVGLTQGLVIITGQMGSGKTTTACSIVDAINSTRASRIFVVAGRPDYWFESKKSLVTQISVGLDCESFTAALDIADNSDLDVVALTDIPTADTLRQALVTAAYGHLVIASLHAESVMDAVQGMLATAGSDEPALRRALSQNIVVISSQRLIRRSDRPGRVAAYDYVTNTPAVREALLTGNLSRLAELQEVDPGCRSLNQALDDLVASGAIDEESARQLRTG